MIIPVPDRVAQVATTVTVWAVREWCRRRHHATITVRPTSPGWEARFTMLDGHAAVLDGRLYGERLRDVLRCLVRYVAAHGNVPVLGRYPAVGLAWARLPTVRRLRPDGAGGWAVDGEAPR